MDEQPLFKTLSIQGKMDDILANVKDTLIKGMSIIPMFYFFDQNDTLHVLKITEKFLLKPGKEGILRNLVKEKIADLKSQDIIIDQVLFLREGFYSKSHPNKMEMNLEKDFNASNGNEALIVSREDMFDFKLQIFDLIDFTDAGKRFVVMSEKPIEELEFCKIDPQNNLKTNFINLL